MSCLKNSVFQFFFGAIGILTFLCITTYFPFPSRTSELEESFSSNISLVLFPSLFNILVGWPIAKCTGQIVQIPRKNLIVIVTMSCAEFMCYVKAISQVNHYTLFVIKNLDILSAILVGVFFSRVKDRKLKLGKPKLIVGGLVVAGIILYGSLMKIKDQGRNQSSLFGIILLLIYFIPNSLLADYHAEIKEKFEPRPIDFVFQKSKWIFLFSLVYSVITLELFEIFSFMWDHPSIVPYLLILCLSNFVTQMFTFYLFCNFKQHVTHIVVSTRIIIGGILAKIWADRTIQQLQWLGVFFVLMAAVFDLFDESEIAKQQKKEQVSAQSSHEMVVNRGEQPNAYATLFEKT